MLLGVKSKKELFFRHFAVGSFAIFTVYLLLLLHTEASFDVALWRALGDGAFSFLFITLSIGPLSVLWKPAVRLVSWRREFGIWFTILGLTHFARVYDFALSEPGIGFPALLGAVALFFAVILAATSSDMAVNYLGPSSWKWLHSFAYVIFYLGAFHAVYFLFFYSSVSNPNPFRYIFLFMVSAVPILQFSAFVKMVIQQKGASTGKQEQKMMQLPIVGRRTIADKTEEVSFDITGQDFTFRAGQYVQMRVPKLLYDDQRGSSRTFSICSSPNNKNTISFAFRNSGSGFKKTLLEMPIGSLVEIEGPSGFFTLPKDDAKELVFIAGGIGITHFASMIRFATEKNLPTDITLLYSNKNEDNAAYLSELTSLAKENPNVTLINKFGHIDADFIRRCVKNLQDKTWYVVGPPPMVAAVMNALREIGIDSGKIRFEDFYGY